MASNINGVEVALRRLDILETTILDDSLKPVSFQDIIETDRHITSTTSKISNYQNVLDLSTIAAYYIFSSNI